VVYHLWGKYERFKRWIAKRLKRKGIKKIFFKKVQESSREKPKGIATFEKVDFYKSNYTKIFHKKSHT
jgi:hypothetical protein